MNTRRARPWTALIPVLCVLFAVGCATLVVDPSTDAAQAGDYTLPLSACEAAPGGGMDICRVTEGDKIESSWAMVVPVKFSNVVSADVDVYYRDIHKSYAFTDRVLTIPWADFFGSPTWSSAHDGEAMALVNLRWTDAQGIVRVQQFRGLVKIVVTKPGYARLPIDSGVAAWSTKCTIAYSTAGRTAINCK